VLSHLDDLHRRGTGIIVVTHDLRDLLGRADRLLAMQDGCLAVDADPDRAERVLQGLAVRVPTC
jgi:biotin transport system ATP-binding protein